MLILCLKFIVLQVIASRQAIEEGTCISVPVSIEINNDQHNNSELS